MPRSHPPLRRSATPLSLLLALATVALPGDAWAQEKDLTDLFDQDPFYEDAGVFRGKGDVPFYADVSFLKGHADSTEAVLGVALTNSAFQFVKEPKGYRAAYEVRLQVKGKPGSFRSEWKETLRVGTFEETLLDRETVVFQSSFHLLPGDYTLELRVRDSQGGRSTEIESPLKVPRIDAPATGYALSKPVLLRFFEEGAEDAQKNHVLYPTHYFEAVPPDVAFFVEVYGQPPATGEGLQVAATLVPAEGSVSNVSAPGGGGATAVFGVAPLTDGQARVYGKVPARGLDSGLYALRVELRDAGGAVLATTETRLSVAAVTRWVIENWKEAVELLAYEANDDERDALEETPPDRRLAAWREFWRVRDPIPATPANEAFETYFRRIVTANENFGTKLRPGWKSDRGRVFVAFGPPNDIIRRPLNATDFPLEIWVYDVPGFQIIFEDRIGFGNFQMANPGTFANELAALERRKHRAIAERRAQEGQQSGDDEDADDAGTVPAGEPAPADTTGSRTTAAAPGGR